MGSLLDGVARCTDAVLAFRGTLSSYWACLRRTATIENLSASTTSVAPTTKTLVASIEGAVSRGVDAVAVHLNVTDSSQHEGMRNVGLVASECDRFGMPLVVIAYPRRATIGGLVDNYEEVRVREPERYTELVCHAVRVAAELGADIVKTTYPGSSAAMRAAVQAGLEAPVVVAGGPVDGKTSAPDLARDCLDGGAAGVCFGRRVFASAAPADTLQAIRGVLNASSGGDE
jgi:DhnA family fructose-bisphosphate aldolase class Ia